jgi:hypothetical protein
VSVPEVNIPPRVRFYLYIVGATAPLAVLYLLERGWAGEPEQTLVLGLASLLNALAAAKTDLKESA